MNKKYRCSWETINSYCNNEATILLLYKYKHNLLPRIVCEECYNKFFKKRKYVYKSKLPVSAINDINNILDILNE